MRLATYFNPIGNTLLLASDELAKKIASDLLEAPIDNHPDFFEYFPEGKLGLHSMEEMRLFKEEALSAPFGSKKKVLLIHDADRMAPYSANALLKTLEEPFLSTTIILITKYPEKLLPTVLSRCQKIDQNTLVSLAVNPQLITILSNIHKLSYIELLKGSHTLAQAFQEIEEMPKEKSSYHITVYQKEVQEKRKEGKDALMLFMQFDALLEHLIYWFRDINLLHLGGNKAYLFHQEHIDVLQQLIEKGYIVDLDQIFQIVKEAKTHFERSGSLKNILENIFIQIHLLM